MLLGHVHKSKIPESHGVKHCNAVLSHMVQAIFSTFQKHSSDYFEVEKQLSMVLAALFHEADDRKYFPDGS